jgi:hypothetical protein
MGFDRSLCSNAEKQDEKLIEHEAVRKGQCMAKSRDTRKDVKKKPQKTLQEKRLAKRAKREGRLL